MEITAIHHVALVVDNLERAHDFYTGVLGLEALPAFGFDYPTQFYRINPTQQLHITEWPHDRPSFRGHVCLTLQSFEEAFSRCKELGIIDTAPWGNPHHMPDGSMQVFIRDPSGNLIELSYRGAVDPAVLTDPLIEEGTYVSGRNDSRGGRGPNATLYHER